MDFIIVIVAQTIMLGLAASLMNWLFSTPVKKKHKYARTQKEIENLTKKL